MIPCVRFANSVAKHMVGQMEFAGYTPFLKMSSFEVQRTARRCVVFLYYGSDKILQ